MEEPNLFRQLGNEWRAVGGGAEAAAACARWARSSPVLAGLASPAAVVALCQQRGDPARSAALLRVVLGHVGAGPWPARTVLQSVLPGVASVARRARKFVGPQGPWQRFDELDQDAVTTAYQRIEDLAAAAPPWPAMAIVDGTWQRLRDMANAEGRRQSRQTSFDGEAAGRSLGPPPAVGEELAAALAEAVKLGIVDHTDGWLVYASRAEGWHVKQLASSIGRSGSWAWRRRVRAEQLLEGVGPALAAAG